MAVYSNISLTTRILFRSFRSGKVAVVLKNYSINIAHVLYRITDLRINTVSLGDIADTRGHTPVHNKNDNLTWVRRWRGHIRCEPGRPGIIH